MADLPAGSVVFNVKLMRWIPPPLEPEGVTYAMTVL
jgi:hypothetical protein